MPIDLADYTKSIRSALKRGKFCCVYVASTATPPLCRIGYAEDLPAASARLQRLVPGGISIDSALWMPDRGAAMTVAKAVQCDLAPCAAAGGWFDISAERATAALEIATFRIFPGAMVTWHMELMRAALPGR